MRRVIDEEKVLKAIQLYRQGLSLYETALELGVSHTAVRYILVKQREPRRSRSDAISAALMKYPKTDFSGDLAEEARICGFMEDCDASYNYRQIQIQTSTTHPAQIRLFDHTFGQYGHASTIPAYNKQLSLYQWNLRILLNQSFYFVIDYKTNPMRFLAKVSGSGNECEYTAGFANAESWIGVDYNNGHPRANLHIANNNNQPLEWMQKILGGDIVTEKNGHRLQLYRQEAVEALRKLPVTHEEKAAARELILRHADNGGIGLSALREYQELRRKIDKEVQLCTMQARIEYIRRHDRLHPKEPDNVIERS